MISKQDYLLAQASPLEFFKKQVDKHIERMVKGGMTRKQAKAAYAASQEEDDPEVVAEILKEIKKEKAYKVKVPAAKATTTKGVEKKKASFKKAKLSDVPKAEKKAKAAAKPRGKAKSASGAA